MTLKACCCHCSFLNFISESANQCRRSNSTASAELKVLLNRNFSMRQWTIAVLMRGPRHPIGMTSKLTLTKFVGVLWICGCNVVRTLRQFKELFSSQMVASLSSWLQSWPGPGETVEWLLSGLLLLHLLVILFFVFSRGNASAFLQ